MFHRLVLGEGLDECSKGWNNKGTPEESTSARLFMIPRAVVQSCVVGYNRLGLHSAGMCTRGSDE
jgi:hypothetical protein